MENYKCGQNDHDISNNLFKVEGSLKQIWLNFKSILIKSNLHTLFYCNLH